MITLMIIFLTMAHFIQKKRDNYYHHSSNKSCKSKKGMV